MVVWGWITLDFTVSPIPGSVITADKRAHGSPSVGHKGFLHLCIDKVLNGQDRGLNIPQTRKTFKEAALAHSTFKGKNDLLAEKCPLFCCVCAPVATELYGGCVNWNMLERQCRGLTGMKPISYPVPKELLTYYGLEHPCIMPMAIKWPVLISGCQQ